MKVQNDPLELISKLKTQLTYKGTFSHTSSITFSGTQFKTHTVYNAESAGLIIIEYESSKRHFGIYFQSSKRNFECESLPKV